MDMEDEETQAIFKRFEREKGERSVLDAHCQEIADYILPRQNSFFSESLLKGEKRNSKVFDSTPILALGDFASVMDSILTPRGQKWHRLKSSDKISNENSEVQKFFDELTNILFEVRYSGRSNFASQNHEAYTSLGAFGTTNLFVDEDIDNDINYKHFHLSNFFCFRNAFDRVDTVMRQFKLTARQASDRWGKRLPDKISNALESGAVDREFEFLHVVEPNRNIVQDSLGTDGMKFKSLYLCFEGKKKLEEGGYQEFPYAVARYFVASGEKYGRSPAMDVLPDIKMLNAIERSNIVSIRNLAEPPLLVVNQAVLQARFLNKPNALNYGGLDAKGRPLVRPLETGARPELSEAKAQQKREVIQNAFLVNLLRVIEEHPTMTATAVLEMSSQQSKRLISIVGRSQTEYLNNIVTREVSILAQKGLFDEGGSLTVPDALRDSGGDFEIVYDSPINRAIHNEDALALSRTMEVVAPLLQAAPRLMMIWKGDEIIRDISKHQGVPTKYLLSEKDLKEMREQMAEMESIDQVIDAAKPVTESLKNLASVAK